MLMVVAAFSQALAIFNEKIRLFIPVHITTPAEVFDTCIEGDGVLGDLDRKFEPNFFGFPAFHLPLIILEKCTLLEWCAPFGHATKFIPAFIQVDFQIAFIQELDSDQKNRPSIDFHARDRVTNSTAAGL